MLSQVELVEPCNQVVAVVLLEAEFQGRIEGPGIAMMGVRTQSCLPMPLSVRWTR